MSAISRHIGDVRWFHFMPMLYPKDEFDNCKKRKADRIISYTSGALNLLPCARIKSIQNSNKYND